MAHLTEERSRGQIILVTGFALAVSFVALALLMNSVIYTENLATRSEAAKASDAVKVRADMANGTEEILRFVNEYNATDPDSRDSASNNYDYLWKRASLGVNNSSLFTRRFQVVNGQAVNATLVAYDRGAWVNQSFWERDFTSASASGSGAEDWDLVTGSEGVRAFRIHVTDPSTLADTGDATDLSDVDNFSVVARDASSNRWEMNVFHDDVGTKYTNEFVVGLEHGGESYACTVDDSASDFWINVSAGTVDGEDCEGAQFGRNIGPTDTLRFEEGDNIFGTYRLLINRSEFAVAGLNFNGSKAAYPPITDKAIYGGKLHVVYEERRMRYETDVNVVPGRDEDD